MTYYIEAIKGMPAYLQDVVSKHLIVSAICLVIFLLALIMTNKAATFCRYVVVIVCIAVGAFTFIFKSRHLFVLCAAALLIMILVRLLLYAIRTIRQNRIDRRIEERALAKAASRRGSWKNRQGYSGKAKPIVREYDTSMSKDEISDVITSDMSESEHAEGAGKAVENLNTNE